MRGALTRREASSLLTFITDEFKTGSLIDWVSIGALQDMGRAK